MFSRPSDRLPHLRCCVLGLSTSIDNPDHEVETTENVYDRCSEHFKNRTPFSEASVYKGFLPILEPCSSGGIFTYWVDEDFNVFENDDSLNPTEVAKNVAPLDISEKGKRHAPKPIEVIKSTTSLNEHENGKQRTKNPALGPKSSAVP